MISSKKLLNLKGSGNSLLTIRNRISGKACKTNSGGNSTKRNTRRCPAVDHVKDLPGITIVAQRLH
jgi:hypothetical protein